ncbi:MAG: TonB-dependent receptor [Candidatus Eisenbacteria bacterium]|uniref:TonB-dependent receptor n=1 Tax=Eiseniibacteriota bacterium TaxID=2212470 RepID=A0A948WBQ8_UNCEI|nr:TonB-dependent receptor [Candidatus Eisenbacteria bacterium]MBU1950695.1 TonB-dependent receptor [Candidatus Eisenbacteria bacterium]MBU2690203.1 TonB-dependent receptor [Candidatus Eisenbacteria bacterium]
MRAPSFIRFIVVGMLILPVEGLCGDPAGLESLLFQEIPSVFTASKTDQEIERATAVVTVITDEDIQRWGARTLYEVLKRVPGFFPSSQATWTLTGSRGLTSDGNDHVLLLIDGHVQNSIIGQGYQQQDMLPILQKVKKIEIVRGPGSVLWGSSAVMGVINIITKDGDGGEESDHTSVAYGARDGMLNANFIRTLGSPGGELSGIVSLSYWESKGYNRPDKSGDGTAWDSAEADNVEGNVEFPWGRIGDWPPIDQHKDGWEIYSKIKVGTAHEFLARVAESRVVYPWDTWMNNPGSELTMRKTYLSYKHNKHVNEKVSINSTIYGDILLQNRFPSYAELFRSGEGDNRDHMQDQSNEERAFGAEFAATLNFTNSNRAIAGLKAVRVMVGPNRDSRFDIAENTPTSTDYPYIGVESGYDNTLAAYFEDTWDFNNRRTTAFLGSRLEYNDFREEKAVLLPRGGLIHSLTDNLTMKYVYNSGYLRPNAVYSKTSGIIVDENRGPNQDILLVDKSERIQNHEVQIYLKDRRNYAGINLFYMMIDNYISFDANNLPQGYKNLGEAVSTGFELEARRQLGERWNLYGNYSYVKAELDNSQHQGALTNDKNQTLNYPRHMYNLGCSWVNRGNNTLNLNLNGWRDMYIVKPLNSEGSGGEFGYLAGEMYFDVDYRFNRLFHSSLELSIFCMNMFDNTDEIGMIVNNGVWYPRGRNIGLSLGYYW